MPILFQSKNFIVEPFADRGGVFFVIIRKKRNIFGQRVTVAKIPFKNRKQAMQDVRNRIREIEGAIQITEARIRKAQSAIRTGAKFGKEFVREINKATGKAPKRRKKRKKKKRRKR